MESGTSGPQIESPASPPTEPSSPLMLHRRTRSDYSPSPRSPQCRHSMINVDDQQTTRRSQDSREPSTPQPAEPQFPALRSVATDRVFPIRSVVSVDPAPTPFRRPVDGEGYGFPATVSNSMPSSVPKRRSDSWRYSNVGMVPTDQGFEASPVEPQLNDAQSITDSVTSQGIESHDSTKSRASTLMSIGEQRISPRHYQIISDQSSTISGSEFSTYGSAHGGQHMPSGPRSVGSAADDIGGLVTARFKHVISDGGHAVITGRDGDTLQRCEDEPIHIPGAIQGFGTLIAFREESEGKFVVRFVSENSKRSIGYSPKQLFALDSLTDILSDEQTENLLDHVDFIRDEDADLAVNGPEVFILSVRTPSKRSQKFWCALHINPSRPDLIICELELEDDQEFPLVPAGSSTPEPPENTLQSEPTEEELAESTTNSSKPLRILRSARKRKGEAAAMEVFNIMSQVQEQLASASTLEIFLKILVGVVKELTGFHRVMIYQFDKSWNGKVVTELVDPRATKDLYKGLNFPASDIPKQARDLYRVNKVRLLYDRDQTTARLVCRTLEDLETPLDLTHAYLRAMSPIHIKYLVNMAVRASMSISINAFDELWGLIACHSYGAKGMRVSFPIRKMCRLVGDSASRNIERLSYAARLQARKLINTVPTATNPSGYIVASSDDLLDLFDADYGLLSIRDETKILGKLEQTSEALALLEYLRLRKITSVITSEDIRVDFPDLRYPPGFSVIAGLLLVPLSVGGNDFIVFFRKAQTREVKWAGNPYEKFVHEGTSGYLEPRKSFKSWSETVVGTCRSWTATEVETAAVLCLVYGKFIEVWRQKEAALQNTQLTQLLLANSAHEVRTPLNAIINYLEIALEGSLDSETRENLSKSHSASKSLIYVINDLLDLTKTEEGQNLIKDDVFDLPATIREAAEMFAGDAKRKNLLYEVVQNEGVPQFVIGDQRRVRQAMSNITANAVQHTTQGSIRIDSWLIEATEKHVSIEISVQDTGPGMSAKRVDILFRDLEQVEAQPAGILDETKATGSKAVEPVNAEKRVLGLGLAFVARVVRNMNGQLRLKSEEGKGSRFVIQLGFDLPDQERQQQSLERSDSANLGPPSGQPTTPPLSEGEVLLVNTSAQRAPDGIRLEISRRGSENSLNSMKSANSLKSFKSGSSAKSVDRLIDAIQAPQMAGHSNHDTDPWLSRSGSRAGRGSGKTSRASTFSRTQTEELIDGAPGSSELIRSPTSLRAQPGQANVTDSRTPVRSVRIADSPYGVDFFGDRGPKSASRVLFEVPDQSTAESGSTELEAGNVDNFRILVAEDDPINSKIMKKRLEKAGHEVSLTINGEECSSVYGDNPASFDVVLMDMQMPIVDGLTSTKIIRSHSKTHPTAPLSIRASHNHRIPIFAVSASLVEKDRQIYIDAGFDGWILKPVDFKRLGVLLEGIVEDKIRMKCLYKAGEWERGGWFGACPADVKRAETRPNEAKAVSGEKAPGSVPEHPSDDPISKEQERLDSLETDAVHADSKPSDPGTPGNVEHAVVDEARV